MLASWNARVPAARVGLPDSILENCESAMTAPKRTAEPKMAMSPAEGGGLPSACPRDWTIPDRGADDSSLIADGQSIFELVNQLSTSENRTFAPCRTSSM